MSRVQPLKAVVDGYLVNSYTMEWRVTGGQWNVMPVSTQDYPHKESLIDFTGWSWLGNGPYVLQLRATDQAGRVIAERSVSVFVGESNPGTVTVSSSVGPAGANPFVGATLYIDPSSDAKQQADIWRTSRPEDARLMDKVASGAETAWFGDWNGSVRDAVHSTVTRVTERGALPVLVAYNIPNRDCGSYSAGGSNNADAYRSWISAFAAGIDGRKAVVILEPDALAGMSCLSEQGQTERMRLIADALFLLKKNPNVAVYVDAGNPLWIGTDDMATRLRTANIAAADGFSLNVSNFATDSSNIEYGTELSGKIGGKHFIVDSSRNGLGPTSDHQWCNPSGRALGRKPTVQTDNPLIDAFLWIKDPGASDGTCNGGPAAGTWWPDYALDLARRASW